MESPQDVNFIRHFNTYLNFFLITPWVTFDDNFTQKPTLAKVYGSFLITSRGFLIIYVKQDKLFVLFDGTDLLSQQIINTLTVTVLEALVFLSIAKSAFFDNENWRQLFENFSVLEEHLQQASQEEKTVQFYVRHFTKHLIFLTFSGYFTWMYSQTFKISLLSALIISPVTSYYYEFLTVCLLISVVEAFRNRFKCLNKKLLIVFDESELVKEAKLFAQGDRILNETVQIFNNVFSYKIILVILHCALVVIHALNTFYITVFVYNYKSIHFLIGGSSGLCYLFVSILIFRKFLSRLYHVLVHHFGHHFAH